MPNVSSRPSPMIVLTLEKNDPCLSQLKRELGSSAVESDGFDGKELVNLIITLTPIIATTIVTIVSINKNANRYVSVKHKGVEIRGVSEEKLLSIINALRSKQ